MYRISVTLSSVFYRIGYFLMIIFFEEEAVFRVSGFMEKQ